MGIGTLHTYLLMLDTSNSDRLTCSASMTVGVIIQATGSEESFVTDRADMFLALFVFIIWYGLVTK